MNENTAKEILATVSECSLKADQSAAKVKKDCEEETFKAYALLVGSIMGNMFTELLAPIYEDHPGLAPEWYQVGQRRSRDAPRVRMSGAMRAELLTLLDEIYGKIASIPMTLDSETGAAEAWLYRSRLHEVLLHIAAAKARLLSAQANAGEGQQADEDRGT